MSEDKQVAASSADSSLQPGGEQLGLGGPVRYAQNIPPGTTQNVVAVSFNQTVSPLFVSAHEIAALKEADPAALGVMYDLIQKQQAHDHAMDKDNLRSESQYRGFGMAAALIVISLLCGTAVFAIQEHQPWVAGIFGGAAGLTMIAGVFIRGRSLKPLGPDAPTPNPNPRMQQIPTTPPLLPR